MSYRRYCVYAALTGALLGCDTPGAPEATGASPQPSAALLAHHQAPTASLTGVVTPDSLPVDQLALVREATARYQNFANAKADSFVDINVVIPHMGRHFMQVSRVDGTFDLEHPEILVYTDEPENQRQLVAVEYAVPLNLSATAPEGFRGNADQWFASQDFGLWLLHAWVWRENPDGVFNPTNSRVP